MSRIEVDRIEWCHSDEIHRAVIIELLQIHEGPGWRVSLRRSNYQPRRCFVEIERAVGDDGIESWCVGFADDHAEAERLFDTTVRTVCLLSTGGVDPVDWAEGGPDDVQLM